MSSPPTPTSFTELHPAYNTDEPITHLSQISIPNTATYLAQLPPSPLSPPINYPTDSLEHMPPQTPEPTSSLPPLLPPKTPRRPLPPPLPPRTPRSDQASLSRSRSTHSTVSTSTSSTFSIPIPTRAHHARLASASSHHLLMHQPSLQSLTHPPSLHPTPPSGGIRDSITSNLSTTSNQRIIDALARLPWAEPPPRISTPSSHHHSGSYKDGGYDQPRFPVSANGSFSISGSGGGSGGESGDRGRRPVYSFLANDPAEVGDDEIGGYARSRRSSRSSMGSGRRGWDGENREGTGLRVGTEDGKRSSGLSGMSGMADIGTSLSPSISPKSLPDPTCPDRIRHTPNTPSSDPVLPVPIPSIHSPTRPISFYSTKSNKSLHPTQSQTQSRAKPLLSIYKHQSSSSTSPSLKSKRKSKRSSGSTIGHKFGARRWELIKGYEQLDEDTRSRDEGIDFAGLVGRAFVLERLLKAGKRVSNASRVPSRQTIRQSIQSQSSSHPFHLDNPYPNVPFFRAPKSSTSSSPTSNTTPRHSTSLRQRLSRRIKRRGSGGEFTEISGGGGGGDERDVDGMFPPERVDEPARRETDMGGVLVFPEEKRRPPPAPPKHGLGGLERDCVHPVLSCSDVTPFVEPWGYGHTYREEGVGRGDVEKGGVRMGQSPHLGHREEGWRGSLGLGERVGRGVWDGKSRRKWGLVLGVGLGVVVIALAGLVGGLIGGSGKR